ncbi:hypothetical protein AX17_005306 [Amanita inopinata Kibby_2008]|nr:hypothetical protein AX17_005306 [Amanita inopinata Kibby_2008]
MSSDTFKRKHSSPWKNKPTLIPKPANPTNSNANTRGQINASNHPLSMPSRTSDNRGSNPYNKSRMTNSLSKRKNDYLESGNPTGKSTLARGPGLQPRKKQKIEHKGKGRALPLIGPEPIDVDQESSFTRDPSSDELNIVDSHPHASRPPKPQLVSDYDNKRLALDMDTDERPNVRADITASSSRLPQEGPSTIWMEEKLRTPTKRSRSSSPIEQYEEEPLPSGKVKQLAQKFEQKVVNHVVRVDFRQQQKLRKSMKPKPKQLLDAHATSSSNFTYKKSPTRPVPPVNVNYHLPIKDCFIGTKLIPDGYQAKPLYFIWNPPTRNISVTYQLENGKTTSLSFMAKEVNQVECTDPDVRSYTQNPIVIAIETNAGTSIQPRGFNISPPLRAHGGGNTITIKMDTDHNNWNPVIYKSLIQVLKNQKIQILKTRNGGALWDVAEQRAAFVIPEEVEETKPPLSRHTTPIVREADFQLLSEDAEKSILRATSGPPLSAAHPDSNPVAEYSSGVGNNDRVVLRRSLRQTSARLAQRPTPSVDPDEVILVYPQGVPGAINITNADVSRLDPGEFLNDTIIEFGLKLWHRELEASNPALAKQVHVFSSFFYKKLNKKNFEEGYESVRKWTSKINLFEKKYIIIPINEHLHWYLAIIYMPEYTLLRPSMKANASARLRSHTGHAAREIEEIRENVLSISATQPEDDLPQDLDEFQRSCTITATEDEPNLARVDDSVDGGINKEDSLFSSPLQIGLDSAMDVDRSEEDAVQEQLRIPSPADSETGTNPVIASDERRISSLSFLPNMDVETILFGGEAEVTTSRFFRKTDTDPSSMEIEPGDERHIRSEETDQLIPEDQCDESDVQLKTHIFTLDSLGTRHPQALRQLTRYLKLEAKDKLNVEETTDALGRMALVPTQPNYCDCGVYLLHFAQTFMTDPNKYFTTLIETKKTTPSSDRRLAWQDHKIADMRQQLVEHIKELSGDWKKSREVAKTGNVDVLHSSDDEIEYVETTHVPAQGKPRLSKAKTGRKAQQMRPRG